MKQFSLIVATSLLMLFSSTLFGQNNDLITKVDGSTLQCKVLKVTDTELEIDPQGDIPFIKLNRNDVASILYSDGTLVKLNELKVVSDISPQKKEQSLEIGQKSTDAFLNALDKLFKGSTSTHTITGDVINYTDEIENFSAASLVTEYKFLDKYNKARYVKVETVMKKGMFQTLEVKYFLDGNLLETRKTGKMDENSDRMQWINSAIQDDRVLVSIFTQPARLNANNTVMAYWLICVMDRIDQNDIDPKELELLKENAAKNKIRPNVLIEKKIDLSKDVISSGLNFYTNEAYYLGKDNQVHHLKVETDHDCNTKLPWRNSCKILVDDLIIKEVDQSFKKNNDVIELNCQSKQGNTFLVSVNFQRLKNSKEVRIEILD
jgi:hypothetical protein